MIFGALGDGLQTADRRHAERAVGDVVFGRLLADTGVLPGPHHGVGPDHVVDAILGVHPEQSHGQLLADTAGGLEHEAGIERHHRAGRCDAVADGVFLHRVGPVLDQGLVGTAAIGELHRGIEGDGEDDQGQDQVGDHPPQAVLAKAGHLQCDREAGRHEDDDAEITEQAARHDQVAELRPHHEETAHGAGEIGEGAQFRIEFAEDRRGRGDERTAPSSGQGVTKSGEDSDHEEAAQTPKDIAFVTGGEAVDRGHGADGQDQIEDRSLHEGNHDV